MSNKIEFKKLVSFCHYHYTRASGKGGQNVNKRDTKVLLIFDVQKAIKNHIIPVEWLPYLQLTNNTIHIESQDERNQFDNKKITQQRLTTILQQAQLASIPKVTLESTKKRIKQHQARFKAEQMRNKAFMKLKKQSRFKLN